MNKLLKSTGNFLSQHKWTIGMFAVMVLLVAFAPEVGAQGFLKGQMFDPGRDLPDNIANAGGGNTLRGIVLMAINFILGFVGLIAVIMMIYGGFVLLTAAGDTDATSKAKNIILFAVIGIIIILFSFAIVNTLFDITTGSDTESLAG